MKKGNEQCFCEGSRMLADKVSKLSKEARLLREALEEIDDLSIHDSVVDACDIAKQALHAAKQHTPSEDEELHNAFVKHLKAKEAKQDEGNG